MTIKYRIATSDDLELIYEFAMKAISDSVLPQFAEDAGIELQERLSLGTTEVFLAFDNDDIVGYAEIDTKPSSVNNSVYIRGLYVLPTHRRERVGRTIINMIREKYSKNNMGNIKVRVRAYTAEGKNFWEKLGFNVHHHAMELE